MSAFNRGSKKAIQHVDRRPLGQSVIDIEALLAVGYDPAVAQDHQLLGHVCLSLTQNGLDVADALFSTTQDVQDLQPRRVGEKTKKAGLFLVITH